MPDCAKVAGSYEGCHACHARHGFYTAQVKVLIEEGDADFEMRDRWSLDALDEAMRERREPVVKFLQQSGALIGGS